MAARFPQPRDPTPGLLVPDLVEAILPNGLRIYVREHHDAPVASLQAWVRSGSIHEGRQLGCGLSHFLEHMLFQGSAQYSAQEIAATVDRHGGHMNAFTSQQCTAYYIDILAEAAPVAVDILADMLQAPRFPAAKFRSEKEVILREQAMIRDHPDAVLAEQLWQTMYTIHPMRHPILGYADRIATVDRAMMLEYYRERYSPERCFFVVTGDVKAESIIAALREKLGGWPRGSLAEPALPEEPRQCAPRQFRLNYPDPLARLALGCQGPAATHPDLPAMVLLAAVLGQGKSSRMVRKLHDELELAIQIHAHAGASVGTGIFGISAAARPENLPALRAAIAAELTAAGEVPLRQAELDKVIRQKVTAHFQLLESNQEVALLIGGTVLNHGDPSYLDQQLNDLRAVTVDDLQRVAAKYLGEASRTVIEMVPEPAAASGRRGRRAGSRPAGPELTQLPGGCRLVTLPDSRLPLVELAVVLPGGSLWEGRDLAGITRLTATTIPAGAGDHSEAELAELLESNAVHLQVSSGNHTLVFQLSCHREHLPHGLTALTAMLTAPTFPQRALERNRQNQISALRSRRLDPVRAAEESLLQLLYDDYPYAFPAIGREASLATFTRDQVRRRYRETCLRPGMAVIGFAGDLPREAMTDLATTLATQVPWHSPPTLQRPPPHQFPADARRGRATVPREQAVVMMAIPACGLTDADRHPLAVLQTVCGGMDSRLFRAIREDAGLAYFTGLYSLLGWQAGFLSFYAGTRPDAVDQVIELIERERQRLAKRGLSEEEFTAALARLREDLAEQHLHRGDLILSATLAEFYGNGFREPWAMGDLLRSLSRTETNHTVRRYLASPATATVIAGP